VCGSAVAEKRNKIICGVTKEPNYLACSSRSRSELVVLIQKDGKIFAQIDIDSRDLDTFDERAVETVEKVADWLANAYEARAGQVEERIAKYGQARPQAADLKHKVDELERLIRIQKTRSVSLNASARNSLLTRLLQPFHQADASTTRKYSGTGLGPAISHRFCQMMRGKISVESRLHEGSAFTFRVPATHQGG
jgi:light-regulated signal transduction histidine kinase (bacteriophytochrome)